MTVEESNVSHPFIGVVLSLISAVLVGSSFILQKKGHLTTGGKHTSYGFFKQVNWWMGMIFMALGEVINFVAYTIAPAILITPLGAFRVIISSILSALFLKEKMNRFGKLGVTLSLLGSTMIIIHAPQQEKISSFDELVVQITSFSFSLYCAVLICASVYLAVRVAPRYGGSNVLVHITICNMIGALTVLCGKGLGIAAKDAVAGGEVMWHPVFWLLVMGNIAGAPVQLFYLNKSLASFDASAVTPLQYVFTNIFLIYGSMLLFDELAYLAATDCAGMLCGFATIIIGVLLLSSARRADSSVADDKVGEKSLI